MTKAGKVARAPRPQAARRKAASEDAGEPLAIVGRPDGYYWVSSDGRYEFGPHESYELAQSHRDAVGDEEALEPGETLEEVEREIGMNAWIDAETGEPAEGQSPPHLREE